MAHVTKRAFFLLVFLLYTAAGARAETNIAVRSILPATPEHELLARQFKSLVAGDLTQMILDAQESGKCDVRIFDISPEVQKGRETEKMLVDKGYADPEHAVNIEDIPANTFIDGVVGVSLGEVDYILEVSGMDGKSTAKIEGSFKEGDMMAKGGDAARALFEKLCPMKPFHVQGGMNDLVISQTVCDVTKSFVLHGTGAAAGISLTLEPAGEGGGNFVVSGNAAGVRWSGGGTYKLVVTDTGGTLDLSGDWKISTPVGNFPGGGTIKTKLTPADDCKQPAPLPIKAKKKKKKK